MRVLTDLQYMVLARNMRIGPSVNLPNQHPEVRAVDECIGFGYFTATFDRSGKNVIRTVYTSPTGNLAVRCHEALMRSLAGMGG